MWAQHRPAAAAQLSSKADATSHVLFYPALTPPSEVPSARPGCRRPTEPLQTQLAFRLRRSRSQLTVCHRARPGVHLRAAALFPVQHAQKRLYGLVTFRGRQSTTSSSASRVTSRAAARRARSAPATRAVLCDVSRGRRRVYPATCFLAAPPSRGDQILPARGPYLARGRRGARPVPAQRAVPLFDERVRRVRGHIRGAAPGGNALPPRPTASLSGAAAICFMAARDAGDGPRWRRGARAAG